MERKGTTGTVVLAALAGVLAAIASAAGVFFRGDLATRAFVTVQGEQVDVLVGGVYRFNSKAVAAEGVGWDFVTLFLVVPALALSLVGLRRGSLRAALVLAGLLAYFAYQYLEYAVFLQYGPLFLVYVGAFALALSALAVLVSRLDLAELSVRVGPRFPRRLVIGLGLFMAGLLCFMWLPLVAKSAGGSVQGVLAGGATLVVQALDLGLLVPLGLFTALTTWKRLPVGYLLASMVVVKACAMAIAICAMLAFEQKATGAMPVGFFVLFALVALGSGLLAAKVYANIDGAAKPAGGG